MNGIHFSDPIFLTIIFSIIVVSFIFILWLIFRRKKSSMYASNVTDTRTRITPKPGRREYKLVNKIECYQEELFWDQDVKALNILKSFKIDSVIKKFRETGDGVEDVLSILTEHNALESFLDAIMHVTFRPEKASWGKVYNSELRVIFTDFFTLNPDATIVLKTLKLGADFIWMQDLKKKTNSQEDQTS